MTDWNEVVRLHGDVVWRTAYRLLGDEADASDCFQKALMDALQFARREPVRHWPSLLRRLATVRSLDMLRQRYRLREHSEPLGDPDQAVSGTSHAHQQLERTDLAEQIRAALAELPPQQAEAITLRWLHDCSYGEIAERMGIDTSTVGVALHRGRKRLRQLLDSTE